VNTDICKSITVSILDQCTGEQALEELKDSFLQAAVRYARLRVDWYLSDEDDRRQSDEERSRAHDAFIDNCNALSRLMSGMGLDINWRDRLGSDRRVIGDLACYIHLHLGLLAR